MESGQCPLFSFPECVSVFYPVIRLSNPSIPISWDVSSLCPGEPASGNRITFLVNWWSEKPEVSFVLGFILYFVCLLFWRRVWMFDLIWECVALTGSVQYRLTYVSKGIRVLVENTSKFRLWTGSCTLLWC